ncbi:MAG: hypothetical protein ABEI13_01475 [Candidatus Paceibacteria bacterium]
MPKTQKQILIRKLLHLSMLVPLAGYWYVYTYISTEAAIYVLLGVLLVGLGYEFIRLETPIQLPFSTYTKQRETKYHVDGINLLLSIILLHAIFNPLVALSVSLVSILGDVVSALGRLYGRLSLGPHVFQHTEGVILAFLVDFLIFFFILGPVWFIGILAAIAVIIENILTTFDDNLVVPIVVGVLAQLMILL